MIGYAVFEDVPAAEAWVEIVTAAEAAVHGVPFYEAGRREECRYDARIIRAENFKEDCLRSVNEAVCVLDQDKYEIESAGYTYRQAVEALERLKVMREFHLEMRPPLIGECLFD